MVDRDGRGPVQQRDAHQRRGRVGGALLHIAGGSRTRANPARPQTGRVSRRPVGLSGQTPAGPLTGRDRRIGRRTAGWLPTGSRRPPTSPCSMWSKPSRATNPRFAAARSASGAPPRCPPSATRARVASPGRCGPPRRRGKRNCAVVSIADLVMGVIEEADPQSVTKAVEWLERSARWPVASSTGPMPTTSRRSTWRAACGR